jgi:hypothetical protein
VNTPKALNYDSGFLKISSAENDGNGEIPVYSPGSKTKDNYEGIKPYNFLLLFYLLYRLSCLLSTSVSVTFSQTKANMHTYVHTFIHKYVHTYIHTYFYFLAVVYCVSFSYLFLHLFLSVVIFPSLFIPSCKFSIGPFFLLFSF